MPLASRQTDLPPSQKRWHNHLPAWIVADPPFRSLTRSTAAVLQAIGDLCDPPRHDGSLMHAYGGHTLRSMARVSRPTLIRAIGELETLGYIAYLGRISGGANTYAIPGSRGALDAVRRRRRRTRRVVDSDGRVRFEAITPGEQMEFGWTGGVSNFETPPVSPFDRGCQILKHPLSHSETQPSWSMVSPTPSNHGSHGVLRRDGGSGHGPEGAVRADTAASPPPGRCPHIDPASLTDVTALERLHVELARRGLVADGEDGLLRVVAAAVRAVEVGRVPAALFARIANRGLWSHVTQAQERRAVEMLRARRDEPGREPDTSVPTPPRRRRVSADAARVRAARAWSARTNQRGDLWSIVQQFDEFRAWSLARWRAAEQEVDA